MSEADAAGSVGTSPATEAGATIVEFRAQNFMRLRALSIRPNGQPLVVIGGKNQQGKTSVLKGIEAVVGGKKHVPTAPLRTGEDEGEVEITLSNGLVARRVFDGGRGKFVVTDASESKVKSPQALFDKLVSSLSFNPLAYSRKRPEEQAIILRELGGIDTTKLDEEKASRYDQRTEKNREVKRLKALLEELPAHPDAPDKEVNVADLASELELLGEQNREALEAQSRAKGARERLDEADEEIKELEDKLAQRREERAALATRLQVAEASAASASTVDLEPVRKQIAEADETNRKVRANAQRKQVVEDLKVAEEESSALTERLHEIADEKRALIANAELPLPGLGFDEQGVTLNGVPLQQASGAEQLRLSVAIGFALNPGLKVLLVDQGSELDEDNLKMLEECAAAEGGQVWLVRVSTGEECSIVIEDGMVRADSDTEPPRATVPPSAPPDSEAPQALDSDSFEDFA